MSEEEFVDAADFWRGFFIIVGVLSVVSLTYHAWNYDGTARSFLRGLAGFLAFGVLLQGIAFVGRLFR